MEKIITQQCPGKREVWVDGVKVFACLLVFLGHLLQGLDNSGIFPSRSLFLFLNRGINAFHVPLFFICSGYLYEKFSIVRDFQNWKRNVMKKALDLGVPYVSFTMLIWGMKKMMPGAGTNPILSLWENLLLEPIPPVWFLYILLLYFLITPTFKCWKMCLFAYIPAFLAMITWRIFASEETAPAVVRYLIIYYNWFLAGMGLAMIKPEWIPNGKWSSLVFGGIYLVITGFLEQGTSLVVGILYPFLACIATIAYCRSKKMQWKFTTFMTPYTMPVFLMHTIFIAVCRTVLLKCGITSLWLHLLLGTICGLGGPILAAEVMKKLKYPEFFLYPRKFIKLK